MARSPRRRRAAEDANGTLARAARLEEKILPNATALYRASQWSGTGNWVDETGNGHDLVPVNAAGVGKAGGLAISSGATGASGWKTAGNVPTVGTQPATLVVYGGFQSIQTGYRSIATLDLTYPNGFGLWKNTNSGGDANKLYSFIGSSAVATPSPFTTAPVAGTHYTLAVWRSGPASHLTRFKHDAVIVTPAAYSTTEADVVAARLAVGVDSNTKFVGLALFVGTALSPADIDLVAAYLQT